ncbi:MAG: diaminopimelate epimerase [Candidatus Omnitrophota bacterium]
MSSQTIHFTKMSAAGNDFIIVDAVKNCNYVFLAKKMCDRSNGIGGDGLLIFDHSKITDYRMRIINADGSEAEMCGNGARCMAAYIREYKKPANNLFGMETIAGIIMADIGSIEVKVKLTRPKDYRPRVSLELNSVKLSADYIDTGVPHAVIFVSGIERIDVATLGRSIRYHQEFKPRGTNVDFVEHLPNNMIAVRTYERGVESETKACGTGSVASAIISYLQLNPDVNNKKNASMKVQTASGDILRITFDVVAGQPDNVWLKGPAKFVAEGAFFLPK